MFSRQVDTLIKWLTWLKAIDVFELHEPTEEPAFYFKKKEPLLDRAVASISIKKTENPRLYPYSVFYDKNRVFEFTSDINNSMSMYYGSEINANIFQKLNQIITTTYSKKESLKLSQIDGVSNSGSEDGDPEYRYQAFAEFARFSYWDYLPKSYGGVGELNTPERIDEHDAWLKTLIKGVVEQERLLHDAYHLEWCNRYVLSVSDRSHRFSACAHKAINGDSFFDQPLYLGFSIESLNWEIVNEIMALVDTYVITADRNYQEELRELLGNQYGPPTGVFTPRWSRGALPHSTCIYVVLKPCTIQSVFERAANLPDKTDICMKNRELIKPQLDALVERKLALPLDVFIRHLQSCWSSDN